MKQYIEVATVTQMWNFQKYGTRTFFVSIDEASVEKFDQNIQISYKKRKTIIQYKRKQPKKLLAILRFSKVN